MAREQGTFKQSVNYEIQKEGTIDARQFVDVFADLLNFTASDYIAEGFPVTVRQDSVIGGITYKKGWYQFLGGALNNANNWEFMGGGSGGGNDSYFLHEQNTPSAEWVCEHNLGKIPIVDIIDSANQTVVAEVTHDSVNKTTIAFSGALTGKAIFKI